MFQCVHHQDVSSALESCIEGLGGKYDRTDEQFSVNINVNVKRHAERLPVSAKALGGELVKAAKA